MTAGLLICFCMEKSGSVYDKLRIKWTSFIANRNQRKKEEIRRYRDTKNIPCKHPKWATKKGRKWTRKKSPVHSSYPPDKCPFAMIKYFGWLAGTLQVKLLQLWQSAVDHKFGIYLLAVEFTILPPSIDKSNIRLQQQNRNAKKLFYYNMNSVCVCTCVC